MSELPINHLELAGQCLPGLGIAAAEVTRHDLAVLIQDGHCGLAVEPEAAGELGVRV